MERKVVALMPMKGHSERIPGKNTRPLHGKPLCFWMLETLFKTPAVSAVVINTDSEELARLVTQRFPVRIHMRPEAIRGDFVAMNKVLEHDLSILTGHEHFLQTHSTNPLLKSETLSRAIETYFSLKSPDDSVFSVTRHQARFFDSQGKPLNHDPNQLLRTQDLPPIYEENSNFYLFSRKSFARRGARIGDHPKMFPMDMLEAVDIDETAQWRLVEALLHSGKSG